MTRIVYIIAGVALISMTGFGQYLQKTGYSVVSLKGEIIGKADKTFIETYDINGKKVKTILYVMNYNAELEDTNVVEYDTFGNVVYFKSNDVEMEAAFDANGNPENKLFNYKGLMALTNFKNTYDTNGRLTKSIYQSDDNDDKIVDSLIYIENMTYVYQTINGTLRSITVMKDKQLIESQIWDGFIEGKPKELRKFRFKNSLPVRYTQVKNFQTFKKTRYFYDAERNEIKRIESFRKPVRYKIITTFKYNNPDSSNDSKSGLNNRDFKPGPW